MTCPLTYGSLRAQNSAASALAAKGRRTEAAALLREIGSVPPESVEVAINRIAIDCPGERITEDILQAAEYAFGRLQAWRFTHYDLLERLVAKAARPGCPAATEQELDRIIAAADGSPGFRP